jgi:Mce-associated membrane protein
VLNPRRPLLALIALVVVLAGVATWLVITWIQAGNDRAAAESARDAARAELARIENDESIPFARTRDEVSRAGQSGIVTFNTLDYRRVDEGLDAWEQASTGQLHEEIVARRADSKQAIEQAQSISTATVLSSAVTDLDARAGTATMIAAVKVTLAQAAARPTDRFVRMQAQLQRVEDGWKLSGLGQVSSQ